MAYVAETELSNILHELSADYSKKREFVVGYSGYEPFVSTSAKGKLKKAALRSFFVDLAAEIGVGKRRLKWRKTTWSDFGRLIEEHTIDTMLEPIIPTRRRAAYVVIPYMQMTTNVLVVPERKFEFVDSGAKAIRERTSRLQDGSLTSNAYNMEVYPILHAIADTSYRHRIAVTRGVLEHDILEEYGIPMQVLSPDDIEQNIIKSLKRGRYFFADQLSAAKATQSLYKNENIRSRIVHLFREDPPLRADCGFAVSKMNRSLVKYFAYKCIFELSKIREPLLHNIPKKTNWFDGTYFRLLDPSEIPDDPITRYSHQNLLQTTISARPQSGQDTSLEVPGSQRQLGTGQEADPPAPPLSVNIEGLSAPLSLQEMWAITRDWDSTNKRRAELIEKKISRQQITPEEDEELRHLQYLVGAKRQLVMPLPIKELAEIEAELRRKGLWRGD